MCNQAVDNYAHTLELIPDCNKTQKMCNKLILLFLQCNSFLSNIRLKRCVSTLKYLPDWFVRSTMIKKLDDDLFSNNDIIFVNEDSDYVTFFSNEMGILNVDPNNIYLDDVNFVEDDPETIIHVRLMACQNKI